VTPAVCSARPQFVGGGGGVFVFHYMQLAGCNETKERTNASTDATQDDKHFPASSLIEFMQLTVR